MAIQYEELTRCPLFSKLASADLLRIVPMCRLLSARAGDPLFREGQECDGFYIVLSGAVRVYKIGPDGRERTLHIVRPPQSFAEAAMFAQGNYPAFAAAMENSRLLKVLREPFLRELREQPGVALGVFESLTMWMRRLLDQLENETFLNARAKLANYLLREARHSGTRGSCVIDLAAMKKDIAAQLGMAPETFSRALADLEARSLIKASGRRIELLDPGAVEEMLLGGEEVA